MAFLMSVVSKKRDDASDQYFRSYAFKTARKNSSLLPNEIRAFGGAGTAGEKQRRRKCNGQMETTVEHDPPQKERAYALILIS